MRSSDLARALGAALVATLVLGAVAHAEAPPPYVLYAFPAGAQRGTTVDVVFVGQSLDGATAIHASSPGVVARIVSSTTLKAPPTKNSATIAANSSATFTITVAPDAEVGVHELRVLTPAGISNRIRFHVGALPEVREREPNSTRELAHALAKLPVVVNGQLLEGDRDLFRFAAKGGQTIVARVDARSLIPYVADAVPGWNDASLTLFDATGHELETVDDFRSHPDPVLVFRVPRDGDYVLEVRDVLLRGRGDFVYRLSLGELPFVTDLFPLGGQRGTTTKVHLRGVNLATHEIEVRAESSSASVVPVSVVRGALRSNETPFATSDLPALLETEPNDGRPVATRIDPPVVVDGRIDRPGDVDQFVFFAEKGQRAVLEVQARRLGSPLDSILTLLDPKGQKIAENDDSPDPQEGLITHHADSRIVATLPVTGEYVVKLRDVQGKGGPEYAYRLLLAAQRPDFALRVTPDNPRAARGDCAVLTVKATRRDGFTGPIELAVRGLPAGFVASAGVIPAGQDACSLTVFVPREATLGVVTPAIVGSATVAGKQVVREATPAEEMTQSFILKHLIPSRDLALSVLDEGPYTLALAEAPQPVEVARGGKVEVRVRVVRQGPDRSPVWLKPRANLPGVNVRGATIQPESDEATITIAVTPKAAPGSLLNVIVTGTARAGNGTVARTLPAIPVRVVGDAKPRR